MIFKNKMVFITGASGFIGSHLVDRCLKEGAEKVIGLDNFVAGTKKNIKHLENDERFDMIKGDVRDFNLIKSPVQNSDYIFHEAASKLVAALDNPFIDLTTNAMGTLNILEAAKECDARIVHASTGSVFGSSDESMKESHSKNPTTLYGISKLTGENYCMLYAKELGLKVSVLRYFHVFGPRQDYLGEAGVVSIFLYRVLTNKPPIIFGSGKQIRCFTYVDDDIDATLLLAQKKEAIGEDYNVASKTRISVNELADTIIKKYATKKLAPVHGKPRLGENMKPIPNTEKIEKLGFEAKVSFEKGLERTKNWVKEDI